MHAHPELSSRSRRPFHTLEESPLNEEIPLLAPGLGGSETMSGGGRTVVFQVPAESRHPVQLNLNLVLGESHPG